MNMHSLHTKLRESCEEAFTQMRNARDIFLNEIALNQANLLSTDSWVPSYPVFHCGNEPSAGESIAQSPSMSDVKSIRSKKADMKDEKAFRGDSPLRLLKTKGSNEDLAGTTNALMTGYRDEEREGGIDGEPVSVENILLPKPVFTSTSPVKGLIAQKQPVKPTPNKWRENVKSPTDASSLITPSRPPLHPTPPDAGATIPILPSNANACWPPKSPPDHQTPKPSEPSAPPSGFAPRYTPAPGPIEIVTESLVPLPFPPAAEDQYEMTEWEDSDTEMQEDESERKRLNKKIPPWCIGWIETAKTQTSIDPDTVFGMRIPRCDLSVLFGQPSNAYMRARNGKRGSSGEWGMDDMTRQELSEYRQLMGHTQQLEQVVILRTVEHLG